MMATSTIVPPCISKPDSSRRSLMSVKIFSPMLCFSSRWRNFGKVVASGTCSRHKIYAKKTTHGVAVLYGVLCPFVGQVEPCLHQIHPQHRPDTPNRSSMLSLRIVRSDHFYPCFPRDDFFHLVEKFLPLRRLFPVSVFNIRECYPIFHTAHLPCFAFLYYTTFQIFLQGLH